MTGHHRLRLWPDRSRSRRLRADLARPRDRVSGRRGGRSRLSSRQSRRSVRADLGFARFRGRDTTARRASLRVRGRSGGGIVHMRSFLSRRTRIERELREAQRPSWKTVSSARSGQTARATPCFSTPIPRGSISCRAKTAFLLPGSDRVRPPTASLRTGPSTSTTLRIAAGARSALSRGRSKIRNCPSPVMLWTAASDR